MFRKLSLTCLSMIKSLSSLDRSGQQQKTQKPKSRIADHVSYSIGYGSSFFEDRIIDDDSQEEGYQLQETMDVSEAGSDSTEQMDHSQMERKRQRSKSGSSSPDISDTPNKKSVSSNDAPCINDEADMDDASTTAHFYHAKYPSAFEKFSTGLGGARGRTSTGITTCCCGQNKTKSNTRIISRHDMLPYIERVFTHQDSFDRLKDSHLLQTMIRQDELFSVADTNIVNRLEDCDKNVQRHVATVKCYADLLYNLRDSHYFDMEEHKEILRARKKSFDDDLIALEQHKEFLEDDDDDNDNSENVGAEGEFNHDDDN